MSGGPEHQRIQVAVSRWLRRQQGGPHRRSACSVVLTDLVAVTRETPDVIGWNSILSVLVEVKASRADFLRDAKKTHRLVRGMGTRRYFAAPAGMLWADEIPVGWGLLAVTERGVVMVTKESIESVPDRREEIILLVSALRRAGSRRDTCTEVR